MYTFAYIYIDSIEIYSIFDNFLLSLIIQMVSMILSSSHFRTACFIVRPHTFIKYFLFFPDYAEPEVLTGGQKVGVTFRPPLEEGYTVPFSMNHYDTPNQLPEYAEPLRIEPEYATPFNEPVLDSSINTQLKTLQNLSHLRPAPSALQYDCPAHQRLSNGYCTPFINSTANYTQPQAAESVVLHTYHEPL